MSCELLLRAYQRSVNRNGTTHRYANLEAPQFEVRILGNVYSQVAHKFFRFHSILYNAQALQAAENQSRPGPSESDAVSLYPLKYDEEVHISFEDGDYALNICV